MLPVLKVENAVMGEVLHYFVYGKTLRLFLLEIVSLQESIQVWDELEFLFVDVVFVQKQFGLII